MCGSETISQNSFINIKRQASIKNRINSHVSPQSHGLFSIDNNKEKQKIEEPNLTGNVEGKTDEILINKSVQEI